MTATATLPQTATALVPAHWPGITLDELNAKAAMQTRVDRKYIVDGIYAAAVLADLPANASVLEINGERDFAYDSVYFDTNNLDSYRLAATGRRNRYKIRTRSYVDTGATFLEVKTEGARAVTVKERIPYPAADRAYLNAAGRDYVEESLRGLIDAPATAFEPVLSTGYRRTTVLLPASDENPVDSRMTIDTHLTWTPPQRPCPGQALRLSGGHRLHRLRHGHHRNQIRLSALRCRQAPLAGRNPPQQNLQVRHRHGSPQPGSARQQMEPHHRPQHVPTTRSRRSAHGRARPSRLTACSTELTELTENRPERPEP